jgi:uncharacterized protein YjcR
METRERVLALLKEGLSNAEIARQLKISKVMVGKHKAKLIADGLWQEPAEAAPKAKEGREPTPKGKTPSTSTETRKQKHGKPPPPGPHSSAFKKGQPGGPGIPPEKAMGNKNALKHGLYETIHADTLDPEELLIFCNLDTGVEAQLEEEIRLLSIRERRMMQRIAKLKEQGDGLVLAEETTEDDGGDITTKKKRVGALGAIQAIEDALTKVQERKAKFLALKADLEKDKPPGDQLSNLDRFLAGVDAVVDGEDE